MSLPSKNASTVTWGVDILLLTLTLGGLFFLLLGIRPLFVPDEGRYAEIAREMFNSGDYITPYLNGIKYFEKPVLFYWLETAFISIGGLNLWSIRSVNALFGLLGCLMTYACGRQLYDRQTGLLAAFILGTSLLFFVMTQMISLDLTVTVFLTASLYGFLLGYQAPFGVIRRRYFYGAAMAAACAVMTKGLIGIIFPIAIITPWLILSREGGQLKKSYFFSCLALFLLIAAPWHILVSLKNPEFAYFYFIEQQVLRYSTLDIGHYQPFWFFIPCIMLGFFPWIVFLPQAFLKAWQRSFKDCRAHKIELFFLLWILFIFAFFSFSKSKLIPYILPIFPALAMLTAYYLREAARKPYRIGYKLSFLALCGIASSIACFFYISLNQVNLPNVVLAKRYLYTAAFILVSGSLTASLMVYWNKAKAIPVIIITSFLFLLFLLAAVPSIDNRTILPLAKTILLNMKSGDKVITYNQYYQDLPYYLQQKVHILNWRNELTFGMSHQKQHEWMIDDQAFWKAWHQTHCVFVIMDKAEYAKIKHLHPTEIFTPLKETVQNILISNCKSSIKKA